MDATDLANARSQGDQQQERIRQIGAMSREGLQQTAETVRAGMRETGETTRASARNQIDATRVGLEGRRVGMEERTRGIADRAAEQQEQLRAVIADPRATLDARLQAQQSLRAFLGKGQEDHWKGVVLQGGVDANGVKTDSVLGAVNERTGEMRKMDSSQAASAKSQPLQNPTTRPVGTVSTLNGKTAVWDGKKWVANP
ncbi:hypothetical protein [Paracidovorax avenae]|uniref:hypothetical protein n=1 Tax=Paracidovorax avenae TaxID=80867 RepID=UPI001313EE00|nr:hypothetical protein [Paracidovorax avenae]